MTVKQSIKLAIKRIRKFCSKNFQNRLDNRFIMACILLVTRQKDSVSWAGQSDVLNVIKSEHLESWKRSVPNQFIFSIKFKFFKKPIMFPCQNRQLIRWNKQTARSNCLWKILIDLSVLRKVRVSYFMWLQD